MSNTAVDGGTVVNMDRDHRVIEDRAVVIEEETIQDVGQLSRSHSEHDADTLIDATSHAVLSKMTAMRESKVNYIIPDETVATRAGLPEV